MSEQRSYKTGLIEWWMSVRWRVMRIGVILSVISFVTGQVFFVFYNRAHEQSRYASTIRRITRYADAISLYNQQYDAWPDKAAWVSQLSKLAPDDGAVTIRREPIDGWNRVIKYSVAQDNKSVTVLSAGRDGKVGTKDDIRKVVIRGR